MKKSKITFAVGTLTLFTIFILFFIKYITTNNWIYIILAFLSIIFGSTILLIYYKIQKNKINKQRILYIINNNLSKCFQNIKYNQKCNIKKSFLNTIVEYKDSFKMKNYIECNYNDCNIIIFDNIIEQSTYSSVLDASSLIKVFNGTWFIVKNKKQYEYLKLYTKNICVKKIIRNDLLHKEWFSKEKEDYKNNVNYEYFNNNFDCYTKVKDSTIQLDEKSFENIKQLYEIIDKKGLIICLDKNNVYIGLDLGKSLFESSDDTIEKVIRKILDFIKI